MTAWISNGVVIAVGDGASPEVFTAIGEVISIDGPSQSAPVADATALDDTAKVFLRGIEDGGTVNIECHCDPADAAQDTAYTQFTAGTNKNWKITLTDTAPSETITFAAFVVSHAISVQMDQTIKLTLGLKITGNTAWA